MDTGSFGYEILFGAGSILSSYILWHLSDAVIKVTIYLLRKLVVRTKRTFIIWTHSMHHTFHKRAVCNANPTHAEPLFICMNSPCDTLFVNTQALGVPEEEVSGAASLAAK